jgi:hypothetical protein
MENVEKHLELGAHPLEQGNYFSVSFIHGKGILRLQNRVMMTDDELDAYTIDFPFIFSTAQRKLGRQRYLS